MGKMKDLVIDQMNNQLHPPPDLIDLELGKSMWIVEDYKIWAETYEQAVRLLPMIKSY